MSSHNVDQNLRIPVVTNLVVPGDPVLKRKALQKQQQNKTASQVRLQTRIDELQQAIGQDDQTNLTRAHAIRAEANTTKDMEQRVDAAIEKHIDKDRARLLKQLHHKENQ